MLIHLRIISEIIKKKVTIFTPAEFTHVDFNYLLVNFFLKMANSLLLN